MKILLQIVFIAGIAGLLALGHRALLGWAVPGPADAFTVSLDEVAKPEAVTWVDARPYADYRNGHYPGAVHLDEESWESGLTAFLDRWDPDQPVVVYCDGEACMASKAVAERLREELQIESVFWLEGGWDSLKDKEGGL